QQRYMRPPFLPLCSYSLTLPRPPCSPLFPYTTLFRSELLEPAQEPARDVALRGDDHLVRRTGHRYPSAALEVAQRIAHERLGLEDRKSTRLNSSHVKISYAVFCLKKKKQKAGDAHTIS